MVVSVTVFDVSGRKLIECHNTSSVDVSALESGVYLVRVVGDNGATMAKVVKR